METDAPKNGWMQRAKTKVKKIRGRGIRRYPAHDERNGGHETRENPNPVAPISAMRNGISLTNEPPNTANPGGDSTVYLPKPQEDEGASPSKEPPNSQDCGNTVASPSKEVCPASVDITSADNEKLVKDMPKDAHTMLIKHLQPKNIFGRNYKLLADKLGYSYQDIQYLESKDKPVQQIIEEKGDRTIAEWISLLKDMERKDVAEDLEKFIEKTPTPRQLKLRKKLREKNKERKTCRESYDAFICFGNEDRKFVDKVLKKLESAPYNLHFCSSERDFLPGGSVFETTAVAIEKTCKKFVVILSSNFDHSEGAHYESQIATGLSPGAKEKRLIPVLIEEAYRSKIPRTISHITYLDYLRQDEKHFWDLLAQSLGWSAK